ncbi:MAG: hypothetical protein IT430_17045 [Phycisphaerales bacterium]|nr:hypothetical protein [Phycisphaerales bacterium]
MLKSALVVATVLLSASAVARAGDLTIGVQGECPGAITLRWQGATPDRYMGIVFALETGTYIIPTPCGGTQLGLGTRGLWLAAIVQTRSDGQGRVTGTAAPDSCGGYVQAVVMDGNPCATSNVVQIP